MTGALEGRVAFVTGATSGIGQATAIAFADHGARVVVAGRDPERGERVVEAVGQRGGSALFLPHEATDPRQVAAGFERAAHHFGRIDALVVNAGIGPEGKGIVDTSDEQIDGLLDINLRVPPSSRSGTAFRT
jgi:NAD(P)-dependent dehydrogenase (short-subunit alcohol dehydrogenase family)